MTWSDPHVGVVLVVVVVYVVVIVVVVVAAIVVVLLSLWCRIFHAQVLSSTAGLRQSTFLSLWRICTTLRVVYIPPLYTLRASALFGDVYFVRDLNDASLRAVRSPLEGAVQHGQHDNHVRVPPAQQAGGVGLGPLRAFVPVPQSREHGHPPILPSAGEVRRLLLLWLLLSLLLLFSYCKPFPSLLSTFYGPSDVFVVTSQLPRKGTH